MTSLGGPIGTSVTHALEAAELDVATVSSDTLRARIRVDGTIVARTGPLLVSVIGTHLRAGRRYLRVDVGRAAIGADLDWDALTSAHDVIGDLGGMLAFDNATGATAAALREHHLHVSPTA